MPLPGPFSSISSSSDLSTSIVRRAESDLSRRADCHDLRSEHDFFHSAQRRCEDCRYPLVSPGQWSYIQSNALPNISQAVNAV